MTRNRIGIAALGLAVLATGCRGAGGGLFDGQGGGDKVYTMREVDRRPVLRGCARYSPPVRASAYASFVTVRFVVRKDGHVDPGSAVASRGANDRDGADVAAVDAATSCVFDPAERKGTPVAVRTSRGFVIE